MRVIITVLDNITETSMPFNEFVLYRANHFNDENHILVICSHERELPKVELPSNLTIIYVGKNPLKIRRTLKRIIHTCKKNRYQYVIHMHQVQSGFITQMSMIGTLFRKKVLFTVHSTFSGYAFHNKFLSFINTFFAYYCTCVSNTSYDDYCEIIKKIKNSRMRALQNGVDTERIDGMIQERITKSSDFVKFIYVARVIPIKNHKFLIDVLNRTNSNVKFIFVGEVSPNSEIQQQVMELGLSHRVEFTGLISRNEVFVKLQESDAYISSSILEGLPISVLEGMYCELPVILSDIKQHCEIAKEVDFIRVLPFKVEQWATEINQLATMLEEQRKKEGALCKEYVKAKFSLERMHREYSEIYDQII